MPGQPSRVLPFVLIHRFVPDPNNLRAARTPNEVLAAIHIRLAYEIRPATTTAVRPARSVVEFREVLEGDNLRGARSGGLLRMTCVILAPQLSSDQSLVRDLEKSDVVVLRRRRISGLTRDSGGLFVRVVLEQGAMVGRLHFGGRGGRGDRK